MRVGSIALIAGALMERQIDLAADHGISYFSFCWYWADNKGPINVAAIEKDSKHQPMRMFMQAIKRVVQGK